ncbi:hypothetical protein GEMRC1_008348 [Eukaryota sp. GEM-RC1]
MSVSVCTLYEQAVPESDLPLYSHLFKPSTITEIVEERVVNGLCGYFCCSSPPSPPSPSRLSRKNNTYTNFCSPSCSSKLQLLYNYKTSHHHPIPSTSSSTRVPPALDYNTNVLKDTVVHHDLSTLSIDPHLETPSVELSDANTEGYDIPVYSSDSDVLTLDEYYNNLDDFVLLLMVTQQLITVEVKNYRTIEASSNQLDQPSIKTDSKSVKFAPTVSVREIEGQKSVDFKRSFPLTAIDLNIRKDSVSRLVYSAALEISHEIGIDLSNEMKDNLTKILNTLNYFQAIPDVGLKVWTAFTSLILAYVNFDLYGSYAKNLIGDEQLEALFHYFNRNPEI